MVDEKGNALAPGSGGTVDLELEQLCRHRLRPPVAQDRLQLTSDGRVLLELKGEWADGTRHLLFEPLELLEKLATLTPRPRITLVLDHGVLAPQSRWRRRSNSPS